MKQYMARDQYGQYEHGLTHPRKDLMERMGVKHARRMFRDSKDGGYYHVGWVIAGRWFDVFEVIPMRVLTGMSSSRPPEKIGGIDSHEVTPSVATSTEGQA